MQAWTMRKDIALAVDKSRLLIFDLNSEKTPEYSNMWGYPVVSGMLHNFGGKKLGEFELAWGKAYRDCDYPIDKDITVFAKKICRKYEIN